MSNTEIFIICPSCNSLDVYENKESYKKTMKLVIPGNTPQVVEPMMFHCQQCGRIFNKMEGRGE